MKQSLSVFRHVLGDGQFGELLVGGNRPSEWRHVFASVQSLHRLDLTKWEPHQFDMIIVDEFHHAEAATYQKLLRILKPKVMLGLTATPERADGQDIRHWFDGHTAVELRLWEALERQLLSPFQYFGIHDEVDLRRIEWKRGGGYDTSQLESAFIRNDGRVRIILRALNDAVDVQCMRGLGFCVSIGHADYMADRFIKAGIRAKSLHSKVSPEDRDEAVDQLRRRELAILFTVDLFNEGVDLPTVDTILMLRPTESATVFLQQLGRGLRLSNEKPYLTVLDFIGAQHANFRFDQRYRAMTGVTRRRLDQDIEEDFPYLPAGCVIELDRVAKEIVLANIRHSLNLPRREMVAELRQLSDVSLATYLTETGFEIEDIYRNKNGRGWTGLREDAGMVAQSTINDTPLSMAIGRLLHLDDLDRIAALRNIAKGEPVDGRLGAMMRRSLFGAESEPSPGVAHLASNTGRQLELRQVADVLEGRIERVTERTYPQDVNPIRQHARYTRNEACIAFGMLNPKLRGEGVVWIESAQADLFFVTLIKTEKHYSASTMYQDRAITETLFQWESQSRTTETSKVGQRYVHHVERGSTVHLFLREHQNEDGALGRPPYLYAGPMTYEAHTGGRPMRIHWRLDTALPADVFHAARLAA